MVSNSSASSLFRSTSISRSLILLSFLAKKVFQHFGSLRLGGLFLVSGPAEPFLFLASGRSLDQLRLQLGYFLFQIGNGFLLLRNDVQGFVDNLSDYHGSQFRRE